MTHLPSAAKEIPPLNYSGHRMQSSSTSRHDMDVSIIDKDETSDKAYHVVDGFVIEDSKQPFPQNGQLSFVPEEYGKEKPAAVRRTRTSNTPKHSRNVSPADGDMHTCEYCKLVAPGRQFLAPSRRFCSLACCKRYSAEKRYYPYGKDEEGIAKAIREGLVHPNGKSVKRATPAAKQSSQSTSMRDQRRRKMASFSKDKGTPNGGSTSKSPRGKKRQAPSTTPSQRLTAEKKHAHVDSAPMEVYAHPTGAPLQSWSSDDVADFLTFLGYEAYIDRFLENELDGKALSLLKDHHLLMILKLRLGPALKICQQIDAIKAVDDCSDTE